jgi:hypothetical protein
MKSRCFIGAAHILAFMIPMMNKNALVNKRTRKQAFSEATTIRHSSLVIRHFQRISVSPSPANHLNNRVKTDF